MKLAFGLRLLFSFAPNLKEIAGLLPGLSRSQCASLENLEQK
jgi:hypothetical protein